jgi:hypothetical protein
MVATPLVVADKFINAGVTVVDFVPTIADVASVTRAEIDAGTDLTDEVIGSSGWQVSSANVSYNPLGSTFTPSIPGRTSVQDSSLTLPQDITGTDVRDVLPRGTTGYIVIMYGGDEPGSPMDVYPVRVSSLGMTISTEGTEVASVVVSFAIPSEPAENVAIPAATP